MNKITRSYILITFILNFDRTIKRSLSKSKLYNDRLIVRSKFGQKYSNEASGYFFIITLDSTEHRPLY